MFSHMKLSENVEIETNEFKASNSRASRLARYSTAAAGVAAVSTLDVDAAMIKVIVTDPGAVGKSDYILDLSAIVPGARLELSASSSSFYLSTNGKESFVTSEGLGSNDLRLYSSGDYIVGKLDESWSWNNDSGYHYMSSSSGIFGFRLDQGSSNYTYGWLKATFVSSSAFTLNSYGYNDTLNEAAIAGQGSAVPDSGPGVVGLALLGAGAAGMRLLRKLRAGK